MLDQHIKFNLYSDSSMKQKSAETHVAPIGHIILIPRKAVFPLTRWWYVLGMRSSKYQFDSLVLSNLGLEYTIYRIGAACKLSITPQMWFKLYWQPVISNKSDKLWIIYVIFLVEGLWPWSYGSWIYNYLCNQCVSPLMLWVQISIRARCTTLCLSVTCNRSVVFSGNSGFLHQ